MKMSVKEVKEGRLASSDAPKAPGFWESCLLPSLLLGREVPGTRVRVLSDLGVLSQLSLSSDRWESQLPGRGWKSSSRGLAQTAGWKAVKSEQIWSQKES